MSNADENGNVKIAVNGEALAGNEEILNSFIEQYPNMVSENVLDNSTAIKSYDISYNETSKYYCISFKNYDGTNLMSAYLPSGNNSGNINVKFSGGGGFSDEIKFTTGMNDYSAENLSSDSYVVSTMSLNNIEPSKKIIELIQPGNSGNGITFISNASDDNINLDTSKINVSCFSGGSLGGVSLFKDIVNANPDAKGLTLYMIDPAKQIGAEPGTSGDINNILNEQDYEIFKGQNVVAFMHANSFHEDGVYTDASSDGGSNWQGRTDFQNMAKYCSEFLVFEAQGDLAEEHLLINEDLIDDYLNYGYDLEHWDLSKYKLYSISIDDDGNVIIKEESNVEEALQRMEIKNNIFDTNISVSYDLINNGVNNIIDSIKKNSLLNSREVNSICEIFGNGCDDTSFTYAAVANIFNDYISQNRMLLSELNMACQDAFNMANSINEMDYKMAYEAFSKILDVDLSKYNFESNFDIDSSVIFRELSTDNIKISKEGLLAAFSQDSFINLSLINDVSDTLLIKNNLDAFLELSLGKLEGPAWDKIKDKMEEYSLLLERKIEYSNNLVDTILSTYNNLVNFLDEYDSLDVSKQEYYEEMRDNLVTQMEQLQAEYDNTPDVVSYTVCDDTGKCYEESYDNSAVKNAIKQQIDLLDVTINELNKLINKIIELVPLDMKGEEVLSNIQENIIYPF